MTDDIVTLLREDFCDFGQWENSCTPEGKCPCCLAADEIERLRRQIKMWIQIADHLAVVVAKHEPMHLALAPYDTAKEWTLDD